MKDTKLKRKSKHKRATESSTINDVTYDSLEQSLDRSFDRAIKELPKIEEKRTKPFSKSEADLILKSINTKGIFHSDIIASNPIANCKEDYELWINLHS